VHVQVVAVVGVGGAAKAENYSCTSPRFSGPTFAATSPSGRDQCLTAQQLHGVTADTHLFPRFTLFGPEELLLVTPHKTGSKYGRAMFARAYNCSLEKVNGEVYLCGYGDAYASHWSMNRKKKEVVLEAKLRKATLHVAVLLRDPLDRALSMYNHFGADSDLGLENHCCADNPLGLGEPAFFFSNFGHGPKSYSEKLSRFERWLSCLGRLTDSSLLTRALSWRHFQPANRYVLANEADTIGRVEDLAPLVEFLSQRLPILKSQLQPGGRGSRPEPWMSNPADRIDAFSSQEDSVPLQIKAKHRNRKKSAPAEAQWIAGHEWANPWSITRCELDGQVQARVEARLNFLYSTDWDCFGSVLPKLIGSNGILREIVPGQTPLKSIDEEVKLNVNSGAECKKTPKDNRKRGRMSTEVKVE